MIKEILALYMLCFRMGAVTFGGGYAMLPILRREIVQNRQWFSEEEIMDYYALSQGLPGIIAVNMSVFIGYWRRKVPGAIAAALGMVSPCIIIISIIYFCLSNFQNNIYVQYALAGISVCVAALILDAIIGMWKKGVKDWWGRLLCLAVLILSAFTDISPILLVIVCAVCGVVIKAGYRQTAKRGN